MDIIAVSRTRPAGSGRSRVDWVDTAKGLCIILVVTMHATLGTGEAMGGQGFMHEVVAFAKPFRMPDFFMISGLFLSRVIDRDWRSYADKRVLHFAYFYVLWLVIQSLFKAGAVSGGTPAGFVEHILTSLIEPYSTLWFIYALALFSVVTKLLRRAPAPILLAGAAALQILPLQSSSFVVEFFCERYVYFVAGWLFAPRIFAFAGSVARHPGLAGIGIALWAALNGALAFTPVATAGLAWAGGPEMATLAELPVVSLLTGIAGALAVVAAATLLSGTRAAEPLRYCGRNSIAIYLAFFLPMAATRALILRTGLIEDIGWAALLVTIAAVLVPLALERVVRHTPASLLFRRPAWFGLGFGRRGVAMQPAE